MNILVFMALSVTSKAQVKFQLSLLSDNKTYMVSMIPEQTWTYPQNITSTAQVTLRYASSQKFMVVNMKNLIPTVLWQDNSYIDLPQTSGGYNFISFALRSQGTTAIPYEAGREVPLFSFTNYHGCEGKVELINNNISNLSGTEAQTYNIGNHWTSLASQKEAYTGNLNALVNCSTPTTGISDNDDKLFSSITAYPVPASDRLNLKVNAVTKDVQKINQVIFYNLLGDVVLTQKVKVLPGEQDLTIDVTSLTSGVYLFKLTGDNMSSKNYKFLIMEP